MNDISKEIEGLTFEQAYSKLEETVQKLETGNFLLEESMALYQQGIALSKYCGKQLDQAELSVKSLMPSGNLIEFEDI